MSGQELVLQPDLPVIIRATDAQTDGELVALWIGLQQSPHTRRNFQSTAATFLEALNRPLHGATLEAIQSALVAMCDGLSISTRRQYVLRVKSLLSFAVRVRYLPMDVGAAIRAPTAPDNLAARILPEDDIDQLMGSCETARDGLMLALTYAAGLRVSELVGLSVVDVIMRSDESLQLSVLGKGGKRRQTVLPRALTRHVLAMCAGRPPDAPLFLSRKGQRLSSSAAYRRTKQLVAKAGINNATSPHWLRHAHASHAMDHGAGVHEVQTTLGHENLATTSRYVRARPNVCTGDRLKADIWQRLGRPAGG